MKDQVDALAAAGLPATFINSSLGAGEMEARLRDAEAGRLKLLYVAPERFDAEGFRRRLASLRVSLLAVDEAHCVSEWGHDFRPSYLRLGEVRRLVGNPPIAALTATATEEVRRDIVRQLRLADARVLVTGFDRRNLVWHVLRAKNDSEKDRLLLKLLKGREGSAIVYAATRKNVDALTALLFSLGVTAVGYHAGLAPGERKRIQERFMSGEARVVVATNAFGMGIDKPDVRIVVHYNMPGNLEAYYQEAGRAGRDGGPSDCVLLHAYPDRFTHEFFIDQANPPREAVLAMLDTLRRGADATGLCAISAAALGRTLPEVKGDAMAASAVRVLEQFGVVRQVTGRGESARLRLVATPRRIAAELAGRDAELHLLRAVWKRGGGEAAYRGAVVPWRELARAAGDRGQAMRLLEVLQAEGFLEWDAGNAEGTWVLDRETPPQRLPVDWRALDEKKRRDLRKLQQMQNYAYTDACRRGFVLRYFGDPAAMEACGACDNCLAEGDRLADRLGHLGEPLRPERVRAPRERARAAAPFPASPRTPAQDALRERLRALRRELAAKHGVLPFQVFSDAVLDALVDARPATPEAALRIRGVGPTVLERYGAPLLELLREHGGGEANGDGGPSEHELVPADDYAPRRERRHRRASAPEPEDGAPPTPEQKALYARLKQLRTELAREAKLPSYCVFADRTLIALARRRPTSVAEMLAVPGVGHAKMEKYGDAFLRALREE
jgi:ATP-dependent DNA helicase RecQ